MLRARYAANASIAAVRTRNRTITIHPPPPQHHPGHRSQLRLHLTQLDTQPRNFT